MPPPTLSQRLKERKLVQWALAYLAMAPDFDANEDRASFFLANSLTHLTC
jgi:hypothetical protein